MIFPNLPTDNLYKFIAFAGAVIVILSVFFIETRVSEVEDKIIDSDERAKIAIVSIALLEIKSKQMQQIIDNSKSTRPENTKKLWLSYSESEIKKLYNELQDSLGKLRIESAKLITNADRLIQLQKRSKRIFHWGVFFILCGMVLACTGFYFWYRKVQKPLDMLLQNELETSESNNRINSDPKS